MSSKCIYYDNIKKGYVNTSKISIQHVEPALSGKVYVSRHFSIPEKGNPVQCCFSETSYENTDQIASEECIPVPNEVAKRHYVPKDIDKDTKRLFTKYNKGAKCIHQYYYEFYLINVKKCIYYDNIKTGIPKYQFNVEPIKLEVRS